ncbi:transposase [Streptomyces sp. DASNCL29]|nr:transposase [Streptomyces sp. DASNCL29]
MDQSIVGPGVPLTDAQWMRIEPLLPDRTPKRGGRWRDHREVIDAIAFTFQTGTQGVHLPEKYGNPRNPRTPAQARHPGGHPGPGGPARTPATTRQPGRQATSVRPRDLQTAQHRGAMHHPPEAVARHRHPLREDRDHLPGRTSHRRHLPLVRPLIQTKPPSQ